MSIPEAAIGKKIRELTLETNSTYVRLEIFEKARKGGFVARWFAYTPKFSLPLMPGEHIPNQLETAGSAEHRNLEGLEKTYRTEIAQRRGNIVKEIQS